MSNVKQVPDVSSEMNQVTSEKCSSSEDIALATNQDTKRRSKRIKSQIEGRTPTANSTNISEENITDDNDMETIEIVINAEREDNELNKFLSSLSKSPETTKSDTANFKEPQMITASKGKGKKTRSTGKTDDLNITTSPNLISPENISDTDNLPTVPQPSTSANVIPGSLNVDSNLKTEPSTSQNKIKPEMTNDENLFSDSEPTSSNLTNEPEGIFNRKRVNLYAPDTGPQMYHAKGNLVTRPIIAKNLPKVFQYLPIYGKPCPNTTIEEFYTNKVREFVGCDLNDEEFEDLENYCSPELLKTGNEIKMQTTVPVMGLLNSSILHNNSTPDVSSDPPNLITLKKFKLRLEKDSKGLYIKKLKYRGVRILPSTQEHNHEESNPSTSSLEADEELEPGMDILYRVRVYRPYAYNMIRDRYTRSRHSVFCCDVVVAGRRRVAALRDRFVCHNDFDLRVDVSRHPDMLPAAKAKEVFPSGFLFINNVFYVDTREGCIDYSAPIREWAEKRNLGHFPKRDMCQVRLDQLVIKLGYPEVYVHQGNCEHVFVFSEVRLLNANDPLRLSNYPFSTAIGQNQTVYCTTCAEFSAKWIVVGSDRVPFDPGFFCDTCFKQYMYKDGQKIGDFKAYRYRGNALNVLKPL